MEAHGVERADDAQNTHSERHVTTKATNGTAENSTWTTIGTHTCTKPSPKVPRIRASAGGQKALQNGEMNQLHFPNIEHRQQMELLRDAMLTLDMRMDRVTRMVKAELAAVQDSWSATQTRNANRYDVLKSRVDDHERQLDFLSATLSDVVKRAKSQAKVHDLHKQAGDPDIPQPGPGDSLPCANGVFLWKITNYSVQKANGTEHQFDIHSPPFFSDAYGYKMCAAIDFLGKGTGKGTHLSVYVCLMKGPYDDILGWPFQRKVTFMLMDQRDCRDKDHVVQTLTPGSAWREFQRPVNERNVGRGFYRFVSRQLMEHGDKYVKDDTVYVKIVVDHSEDPM